MSQKPSEVDLAAQVVEWLISQHWDVYPEVTVPQMRGIADIVAVRDKRIWIIETKMSLSIQVMAQAYHRMRFCNWVSVAIPRPKHGWNGTREFSHKILRDYGIGHITVNMEHDHFTSDLGRLNRHAKTGYLLEHLCEEMKEMGTPGAKGGGHWTPFKHTCSTLREYVGKHPGCVFKDAIEEIQHHYSSDQSGRSALLNLIESGVVKGVRTDRTGKLIRLYRTETDHE